LGLSLETGFGKYVRRNWGAPLIVGFMLLLVVAAVSMAMGLDFVADDLAVCAYCALIVGVILQLVCFLSFGEKGEGED
jgi:heme/copper-type cytochrome/quinol oxidase subunit 4